ncbi:hypothetical protein O6H91_21G060800 [Diphasiastrum complanatum]|uniref:Uncharacterized protein n=2 Tax=Diphasiastrum complanatum TaxID=34168 RepID=A0ACC2ALF2_DIPCM|nr:hypothetical protein O6H91_21G060400 [Diphasiastrum complanatum]KAJ7518240.1 hypothetical protein O6H91_21G060800 [Diphasiastrum complanatum]
MDQYTGIVPQLYKSLTTMLGQNTYRKLDGDNRRPKRILKTVRLGGKSWRFRIRKPRARLLISPLHIFKRLRDAYVRMMISVASRGNLSGAVLGGTVYTGKGNPGRQILIRDEDLLAYIEHLKQTGQLHTLK